MISASAARFTPAVEAALLAHYAVDPLDPTVTPRRMWVLLSNLPPGSMRGNHAGAWTMEAHLLASVVDALNQLTWVQVAKASKKKPKRPQPLRRPGEAAPRRGMRLTDLAGALQGRPGVVTSGQ
jgi:hypothetical protein